MGETINERSPIDLDDLYQRLWEHLMTAAKTYSQLREVLDRVGDMEIDPAGDGAAGSIIAAKLLRDQLYRVRRDLTHATTMLKAIDEKFTDVLFDAVGLQQTNDAYTAAANAAPHLGAIGAGPTMQYERDHPVTDLTRLEAALYTLVQTTDDPTANPDAVDLLSYARSFKR